MFITSQSIIFLNTYKRHNKFRIFINKSQFEWLDLHI